jgi:hypothetical protein
MEVALIADRHVVPVCCTTLDVEESDSMQCDSASSTGEENRNPGQRLRFPNNFEGPLHQSSILEEWKSARTRSNGSQKNIQFK